MKLPEWFYRATWS